MDESSWYNSAFPALQENVGVSPQEDDWAFSRFLRAQMPKNPALEVAPSPPHKQDLPTPNGALYGTGQKEEPQADSDLPSAKLASAVKDEESEEPLSQKEKLLLKQNIESVKQKIKTGPLVVKSFGVGKKKADASDVSLAVAEEGYGGKTKKVKHRMKFE